MSVSLSEAAVQGQADSTSEVPKAPEQRALSPEERMTQLLIERSQQDFSDTLDSSVAEGTTTLSQIDALYRGYENIIERLQSIGVNISLDKSF